MLQDSNSDRTADEGERPTLPSGQQPLTRHERAVVMALVASSWRFLLVSDGLRTYPSRAPTRADEAWGPPTTSKWYGTTSRSGDLSERAHPSARPGSRPQPTAAERAVADLLPIEADPARARRTRDGVRFWFHTFCLNRAAEIYTPGVARDHRYRLAALPDSFGGQRVLDVGTFDGFYAFLAEARGAERVVAVDNEQYRSWVKARWGVELAGGEGFRAISGLLDSHVEYRRLDAFELEALDERFDVIFCWGILHRVKDPLGLLRILRGRLAHGGRVLLETYGATSADGGAARAHAPGEVYRNDDHVYWGFTAASLDALAACAGFPPPDVLDTPVIDGHPRILATLDLDVSTGA